MIEAFFEDIVVHPEDSSPWLILADWLEDHADPRAELVRLTWQLQYEADHADFKIRESRVQTLLAGGMFPVRPRWLFDNIECAWISPGSFVMGSPDTGVGREKQHPVTLTKGFYLGVYPVTQGQWREVMGDNPSVFSRNGYCKEAVKGISDKELEWFPVENVSWEMAEEFCAKLSKQLGQVVRLPSEAEWEYACRAGTTTPFHFGSVLNGEQANCNGNHPYLTKKKGPYLERPTPVGQESYPANAWGLHDLHGNVWEWCADGYLADLSGLPNKDPLSIGQPNIPRVLRGGSWRSTAWYCRADYCSAADSIEYCRSSVGFRILTKCSSIVGFRVAV